MDALLDAVIGLLDDPDRYNAISRYNLSLVQDGPFSLRRRNDVLLGVYGMSLQENDSADADGDWQRSRFGKDDRLIHYACRFSAVAEATKDSFKGSRAATESSLLVPSLSVSDAGLADQPESDTLERASDLTSREYGTRR